MKSKFKAADLITELSKNPMRFLSKAITLVESQNPLDEKETWKLLQMLPKAETNSFRIAITGAPGVGKSTFIEALGMELSKSSSLAVLSIDPTGKAGGSILGDKTRMNELSKKDNVFIRPSPSNLNLGGMQINTPLSIKLCEATAFKTIIIETVGVGQSEVEVKNLCDFVILLVQPATGDELQVIKKGIMEIADLIVVNKADGNLKDEAENYAANLKEVLQYSNLSKSTKVFTSSALKKIGLESILNELKIAKGRPSSSRHLQENHFWKQVLTKKLIERLIDKNQKMEEYLKSIKTFEKSPDEVIDLLLNGQ